jgi:uracil-DNA glycosylase
MIDNLIGYLRQEQQKGVTHVELDEGARQVLRGWVTAKPVLAKKTVVAAVKAEPKPAEPARELVVEGNTNAEKIASLRQQAKDWPAFKSLGSLREVMVFSVGNVEAKLVFVGEAPGSEEERKGEPFVGPAGQKLDGILKAMNISRSDIYLTNVVKFRPSMPQQTTNNRAPNAAEMAVGMEFVKREIEILQPQCIVALGGTAANGLLGMESVPVGRLREEWHEFMGIPLRVTFHPSYLLRTQSSNSEKRKLWEDMLAVMERLQMPISDKQRGYFLT